MRKYHYFPILIFFSLLLNACGKQELKSGVEKVDEEQSSLTTVNEESLIASAFSEPVLEDKTGIAYGVENLFDADYSTSWCQGKTSPDDGPFAGVLFLSFHTSPKGKTIGIMPGYARDEKSYFENNRIKTLVLTSGPSPILEDSDAILRLEDKFEMQFFSLPATLNQELIIAVNEVYLGSKYNDTCIAEITIKD